MNDNAPAIQADGVRIRGDDYVAEAGWFGPEARPRFGWLYRPDTPARNGIGVVIVPPFGREEICAHRSLRHLAEDMAGAGFTAVRFDLDGTGDSAGGDGDPGRVEAWLASVHDACDLARGAGAAHLVLVGVRLGATLAALAAGKRTDVGALVAFNAVIHGKAYLRELRAFQMAMNLQPSPQAAAASGQESSGFLLGDEACAALKAIDLVALDAPPAPIVEVVERDDLSGRDDWSTHLQGLGARVHVHRAGGYVDMLADPHANRVAREFIGICIACARSLPDATGAAPSAQTQSLRSVITLRVGDAAVVEEVVAPGEGMFGILARPPAGTAERGVLMFNAGAIRHIGSNRTDVPLSRRLAAAGLQVLRADLTGIGDSTARAGEAENIVYGPHCLADAEVLVAWLRARGVRELSAGGMCSGAWLALRAAMAGQPIARAYLVNCGVFTPTVAFDPEGSSLFGDIAHYNQSVRSSRAWRKLLRGQVAFGTIMRVAGWHMAARGKRLLREAARRVGLPLRGDLGGELTKLARRGVAVHFLYAANDPGLTILRTAAGSVLPRWCRAGVFATRVFDGPDHTFTQRWAQQLLDQTLLTVLKAPARNPR